MQPGFKNFKCKCITFSNGKGEIRRIIIKTKREKNDDKPLRFFFFMQTNFKLMSDPL